MLEIITWQIESTLRRSCNTCCSNDAPAATSRSKKRYSGSLMFSTVRRNVCQWKVKYYNLIYLTKKKTRYWCNWLDSCHCNWRINFIKLKVRPNERKVEIRVLQTFWPAEITKTTHFASPCESNGTFIWNRMQQNFCDSRFTKMRSFGLTLNVTNLTVCLLRIALKMVLTGSSWGNSCSQVVAVECKVFIQAGLPSTIESATRHCVESCI